MKTYCFVLGTNQNISIAEIRSLFSDSSFVQLKDALLMTSSSDLDVNALINSMGGVVKIGEVLNDFSVSNRNALSDAIKDQLISEARSLNSDSRFNFGFSSYTLKRLSLDLFKLGLSIKKDLKNMGVSSRMVSSKEEILSSVIVEQNNLLKNGLELCFFSDQSRVYLVKTLAVQNFKDLSKRDFGRPNRDDHSGMIPPKLAQVMINLARGADADYADKTILDPFCGSGTILMEAYLMNFRNIIASDISDKAVKDSLVNINWIIDLKEKKAIESCGKNIDIFQASALDLAKIIDKNSVDYIVTEPYLGPQRGFKDFSEVVAELNVLYSEALKVFYDLLKTEGRLVMVWPQFRAANKTWKINPNILKFQHAIKRGELVHGRENQKVWREIIVLTKQ